VKTVIVLTHRLCICEEWEKCFELADIQYKTINSENIKKGKARVIITTYQTYINDPDSFKQADLVIYDEAHVLNGNCFQSSLNIKGKKLFLTATPSTTTIDLENEKVTTITLDCETIAHVSLHDAIEADQLCGYRLLCHNKPSAIDCREHIHDLLDKFGRKKILVYYNTCEDAKQAFQFLLEKYDVFYIDASTKKADRTILIKKFENSKQAIIVNVNVLSEGVSIPCVDCVLIMDKRNSERALIQILGRALRLYEGKDCAILCIPSDCLDTMDVALTSLFYDAKNRKTVSQNLLFNAGDEKELKTRIDEIDKKLIIIDVTRNGGSLLDYKVGRLSEIFKDTGELVLFKYKENGTNYGHFQSTLIQALSGNNNLYKKEIPIWKLQHPELFLKLQERVENASRAIKPEEKMNGLAEIFKETGNLVLFKYKENGTNYGHFQSILIQALSGNNNRFKKEIPNWKLWYPELFLKLQERIDARTS